MGYVPEDVKDLYSHVIPARISKKDIQLRVEFLYCNTCFVENISVKKANSKKVSEYREMWGFDEEIDHWLKLFTGEITPPRNIAQRDERRLYLNEMPENIVSKIIRFFQQNKI